MTGIPPVVRAAWVNRSAEDAFDVFTSEIGAWWPLPTHGLFGDKSASVAFRDQRLIERSVDGSEVTWGEVLAWEPSRRLVIAWHPGGDCSQASEVEVVFEPDGDGTRVIIEHRGWEIFGEAATERRLGYVGPNAWGYVLDYFADGAEVRPDAVDVSGLAAAYRAFFAEAEQGGFGTAPDGEWNSEQVVAHVALNDAAMLGVCQALVHQKPARFENQICQDRDVLAAFIDAHGDMPGLIAVGRDMSGLVLASLRRLSPDQRGAEVHCCLTHDGETMMDRPMAWEAIAVSTQAGMHLPAHIDQLRNLRG
jgi:uncharacterized protein YndB with AHSA1/START domain